jgi:hypothetical protein
MSEPLPLLYQQVVTLWKQRQLELGDAAAPIQQMVSVVEHILHGFEILSQGRNSKEAVSQFRIEMKQASQFLPDTETIVDVLTQMANPDSRISANSIQQLNTWMRQTLNQTLAVMQPSAPVSASSSSSSSVLGVRPREIIELLDDEPPLDVEPKVKRRRRMIIEDDEDEKQQEEDEEEPEILVDEELQQLEEEGITLKLAPLIWQNSMSNMWQYALFADSQNEMYDARGNFASQDAAKQNMEQVLEKADQAGSQGYRHLLQEAYVAWTQKNENQACRDVSGTERLSIEDSDGVMQQYVVVFTTLGPKQLSKLPDYQQLVRSDATDPNYQPAWEKTFAEIQKRQTIWINKMLTVAQTVDPNVELIQSRITKCQNITGDAPILAMLSMVLKAPVQASEEQVQKLDETLFEAL